MSRSTNSAPILLAGAGPAGIAAAHALHALDLPFDWIAPTDSLGGTLLRVGNPLHNWPGPPMPDGPTLVGTLRQGLDARAISPRTGSITSLSGSMDAPPLVHLDDGDTIQPRFLLLCTGTRPRLLGLDGEKELLGEKVEISVNRTLDRHAGKAVAVAGGGDAALEGALLLAERCPEVHLIHRRSQWRAQQRFVDEITALHRIRTHAPDEVVGLQDAGSGLLLTLASGTRIEVGAFFVRIGVEAALPEGLPSALLDRDRYLNVDASGRTAWTGLLGAGDATGRTHQSVAWAMGTASMAVESILRDGGWKTAGVSAGET